MESYTGGLAVEVEVITTELVVAEVVEVGVCEIWEHRDWHYKLRATVDSMVTMGVGISMEQVEVAWGDWDWADRYIAEVQE